MAFSRRTGRNGPMRSYDRKTTSIRRMAVVVHCYSGRTDGAEGVSMRQFDPDSNPMTEADYGIVLGLFIGIYLGLLVVSALP